MIKDVKYLDYKGNENWVNDYFEGLFSIRRNDVVNALREFCELKGFAIDDYSGCDFADEFPENDIEYFGKEGVAFYFFYPLAPEDFFVIVSYKDFYEVAKKWYEIYANNHPYRANEIKELLKCLKKKLVKE